MESTYTQLKHRLMVYKERQYHNPNQQQQTEIDDMEAEIAAMELVAEMEEKWNPTYWEVFTQDFERKQELIRNPEHEVDECYQRWKWCGWRHLFQWGWYIKYKLREAK